MVWELGMEVIRCRQLVRAYQNITDSTNQLQWRKLPCEDIVGGATRGHPGVAGACASRQRWQTYVCRSVGNVSEATLRLRWHTEQMTVSSAA